MDYPSLVLLSYVTVGLEIPVKKRRQGAVLEEVRGKLLRKGNPRVSL